MNETTVSTRLDDLVETFDLIGEWEQRYAYLIELGERLPPMPAELMTEDNRVKPCMSQLWVKAYLDPDNPDVILYHGECDTSIIKGVLAVLVQLCEGKTAAEIEQLDVDELFERLRLYDHLSPNRHVGVYAIVELMKEQARSLRNER